VSIGLGGDRERTDSTKVLSQTRHYIRLPNYLESCLRYSLRYSVVNCLETGSTYWPRKAAKIQIPLLQHRKAWSLPHCLSTKTTPEIVDFDASGLLGGIINQGKRPGEDEASETNTIPGLFIPEAHDLHPYKRRTIKMQCYPLYSILMALGNPTVHYFRYIIQGIEISYI
jgi:hypothetical protein